MVDFSSSSVPVSRPVLTLRVFGAQAVVGDIVQLYCEALIGSPPILYRFYHENVILGNHSAPSGGGTSFNFSLTSEHSGNYSCEADNHVETKCSEVVTLFVSGKFLMSRLQMWTNSSSKVILEFHTIPTGSDTQSCWISK